MKFIERARESVQKPLYCFLRDAFTQWPTESSSNLEPIVTLWVAYFAPWCAKYPESQIKSSSSKRSSSPARMLTTQLTSPLKSPLGSSSSSSSIVQYDKPLLPAGKEFKFDDKVRHTWKIFTCSTCAKECSILPRVDEALPRAMLQESTPRCGGNRSSVAHRAEASCRRACSLETSPVCRRRLRRLCFRSFQGDVEDNAG